MRTYSLKTIEETNITGSDITKKIDSVPVDEQGNIPEYLNKWRIRKDNQMLVFDTQQEYSDYLSANWNV